jgi:four helix bundle protein
MENSETSVWLDFAFDCKYLDESLKIKLQNKNEEIGKLLHHMINNPSKYQNKEMRTQSLLKN